VNPGNRSGTQTAVDACGVTAPGGGRNRQMLIHQAPLDSAFSTLRSTPAGLSPAEAQARYAEFGPNRIEGLARASVASRFLAQFTHFFAVLLWVAAALALVADSQMPGQGMATLAAAIVGVIAINGLFSFWQEHRAEQTMAALQRLLPQQVRVQRDGAVALIASEGVVPGDVILLSAGDHVPADCRLLEAFGVRVNNATVTGEARALSRDAGVSDESDLLHSRNVLLAGTSVTSGEAKALVFATGMHTVFGGIARLTQSTTDAPSSLQKEITALSRVIALLAVAIGVAVFVGGAFAGLPADVSLIFAIGIIVANVPEGLLPTVTLAMAMAARRMARRRTLVRHLPAVETLGSATVICTDKTGTLTENRMALQAIYVPGRFVTVPAAAEAGFADAHRRMFECASLCHDLNRTNHGDNAGWIGDPMELALVRFAEAAGRGDTFERLDEIPFEPERKRLVTVHRSGDQVVLFAKGAPEELLPRARWIEREGRPESLTAEWQVAFTQAATDMADRGLRVLALAYRVLPASYATATADEDLVLTALVGFEDPPRPEVPAAVKRCHEAGIRIIMVTGDHPHTALAVAREIGLLRGPTPHVMTGADLVRMTDTQIQLALDTPDLVFARVTADQKLRVVTALQRKREIVAVTGDGVNDAPALRAADVGVAMGISGTDVAREAADVVLLDDNFASIVNGVEEGRAIFANIQKFLTYILTSNIPELVPYLAFAFFRMPLALTIVQILAVDLGTDIIPALALGAEPPDHAVMRQPPRRRTDRLLTTGLLVRAYLFLGSGQALASMTAFLFVLSGSGWQWPQAIDTGSLLYREATTACLTAIVLMQILNVHLCRSRTTSIFARPRPANRLISVGIVAEVTILLLIVYTPAGRALFATAPIDWRAWLIVLPFAIAMLGLEEARKAFVRRGLIRSEGASRRPMATRPSDVSRAR
jgi:sodium/potassium-transporting ATPase subunit alpha